MTISADPNVFAVAPAYEVHIEISVAEPLAVVVPSPSTYRPVSLTELPLNDRMIASQVPLPPPPVASLRDDTVNFNDLYVCGIELNVTDAADADNTFEAISVILI